MTAPLKLPVLLASLLLSGAGFAQAPATADASAPGSRVEATPEALWNIRIELQIVSLPMEPGVALAAEMMDPKKIEAACARLRQLLLEGKAKLLAWPIVITKSGQRAVSEGVTEMRYATAFEPGGIFVPPQPEAAPGQPIAKVDVSTVDPVPSAFEVRNVGVTLEVEPQVSPDGKRIDLNIVPQFTRFRGMKKTTITLPKQDRQTVVEQPEFETQRTTTSLAMRNGERRLLAIHTVSEPANHLELHLLKVDVENE